MADREPQTGPTGPEVEIEVDAIAEEYLARLQSGELPDREALLSAHPGIAGVLGRHLALVEMLHQARFDLAGEEARAPTRQR